MVNDDDDDDDDESEHDTLVGSEETSTHPAEFDSLIALAPMCVVQSSSRDANEKAEDSEDDTIIDSVFEAPEAQMFLKSFASLRLQQLQQKQLQLLLQLQQQPPLHLPQPDQHNMMHGSFSTILGNSSSSLTSCPKTPEMNIIDPNESKLTQGCMTTSPNSPRLEEYTAELERYANSSLQPWSDKAIRYQEESNHPDIHGTEDPSVSLERWELIPDVDCDKPNDAFLTFMHKFIATSNVQIISVVQDNAKCPKASTIRTQSHQPKASRRRSRTKARAHPNYCKNNLLVHFPTIPGQNLPSYLTGVLEQAKWNGTPL